jgi:crotonobetainyl-CoA:carnitine CoA-transferase CaiB-like acyl-CoA transferase
MAPSVEHVVAGSVRTIGFPVRMTATPASIDRAAPLFGEHTREVLAEAGCSAAEIEAMLAEGSAVAAKV